MQKQKTVAKWLAIILLCTLAIGSYLLYDAFSGQAESGSALETTNLPVVDNNTSVTPPHVPYYTSLPRKPEHIGGYAAAHIGGEREETLHKAVTVNNKIFAFFSSASVEYDMRSTGLSIAVLDDLQLSSVNTFADNGTIYDCKLMSNGIMVAVKTDATATLYLFSLDGTVTAETALPYFDNGKLYLKDRSLWWFYITDNNLRATQILGNMTLQTSAYKQNVGNKIIQEVLPTSNGFTLILSEGIDEANVTSQGSNPCTLGYDFQPYSGFKMLFRYDKLQFNQILVAGGEDGNNIILHGNSDKPILVAFDSDYTVIAEKALNGCTDGVAFQTGDGIRFIGNGISLTLCRHLDVLASEKNVLSFEDIVAYSAGAEFYLLAYSKSETPYALYSVSEKITELISLPDCRAPRLIADENSLTFVFSSTSQAGLCRMNFGLSDLFVLRFTRFLDIDN